MAGPSVVDNDQHPGERSLPELRAEIGEVRKRLHRFRTSLGRFFVAKQGLIDLMLVAAIAQETGDALRRLMLSQEVGHRFFQGPARSPPLSD